jgi:hypothetical protein
MKHPSVATCAAIMLTASSYVTSQTLEQIPAPWRRSDTTLVQLCFDGLDNTAPKRLRVSTVSEGSMSGSGIDLIGFTLTGRPIYQGSIAHPLKYRSVLIQLPTSEVWLRIDKPNDLERNIDIWRDAPVAMCTADSQASYKMLGAPPYPIESTPCPDFGVRASLKVASYHEQAFEHLHLKANGPKSFNGLRGCRDFVYGLTR